MKKTMTALAAFTLVAGTAACSNADDAEAVAEVAGISGDWVVNLDSAKWENDTSEWVLADGTYNCLSCDPPYEMAANGEWQELDRPGIDARMIEVVDDRTLKTAGRLKDKDTGGATWTLSEDGNALQVAWNDLTGDEPINGVTNYTRQEAGPEGSHPVSGKWVTADVSEISDAALRTSINVEGDTFTSRGNGGSYSALLGGDPVAIEGNDAGVMVAAARAGDNAYTLTFSRDGETLSTTELTVDGDTMTGVNTDASDGSSVRWTATRQ